MLGSFAVKVAGQESALLSSTATGSDNGIQNLLLLSNLFGLGERFGFGGLGGGLGFLGTGGAINTLPIVGDFKNFNQAVDGKCIIIGSKCKPSNSVCAAVVLSIQDVGVCSCAAGFVNSGGNCILASATTTTTTTSAPCLPSTGQVPGTGTFCQVFGLPCCGRCDDQMNFCVPK
ncbi:hypothetical protein BV898_01513 [Hypsibius exemplaris]|uniref:Uncharacterized protein n=1 Tax=Hypsibius exemplaris TaxID=2072580 RepID=A0A1W0XA89_HYPEX|nr:hypothetical protein BV898_01513 [Hypsibius exemplaris]